MLAKTLHAIPDRCRYIYVKAGADILMGSMSCMIRLTLEAISPCGPCPSPRGYHSFTTFGDRHCVVVGGRTEEGRIQGGHMVAIYDAKRNSWLPLPPISAPLSPLHGEDDVDDSPGTAPGAAAVSAGKGMPSPPPLPPPAARSSHRAVALSDRIVIHGGSANEKDPDRLSDVATLVLGLPNAASSASQVAHISWSACDQPSTMTAIPRGRLERHLLAMQKLNNIRFTTRRQPIWIT